MSWYWNKFKLVKVLAASLSQSWNNHWRFGSKIILMSSWNEFRLSFRVWQLKIFSCPLETDSGCYLEFGSKFDLSSWEKKINSMEDSMGAYILRAWRWKNSRCCCWGQEQKTKNTRIVMSDHIDQSTAFSYYCSWPPASTFKQGGNDCKKGSRRRNDLKRAFPERKKRDQLTVELTCRFEVWKPQDWQIIRQLQTLH